MDRYIIREPRPGTECLQGNQIIAFPTSTGGNNMMPETFYSPYSSDFQDAQGNRYSVQQKSYTPNIMHGQPQIMPAIDPNYLAGYSNSNVQYSAGHQHMHREMQMERQMQFRPDPAFGSDYQNRSLTHDRNNCKTFAHQVPCDTSRLYDNKLPRNNSLNYEDQKQKQVLQKMTPFDSNETSRLYDNKLPRNNSLNYEDQKQKQVLQKMPPLVSNETSRLYDNKLPRNNSLNYEDQKQKQVLQKMPPLVSNETPRFYDSKLPRNNSLNYEDQKPKLLALKVPQMMPLPNVAPKKPNETETPKNELQSQVLTRFDKLKALHRSGPRVFSGPVEKVLKWHKTLQDIGVLIIFEIIAKCVSIQPGKSCSKNLVVRDDNGPAMQVVYYEIDFLLPDLKPPCTVRVVGRMMPGTCRLQAFNVRPATGDDMATLSRRAAVASHHVAKLCKEYGPGEKI